jgi:hypothetical protein
MPARNETGATLTKGTVVYISGGAGNKPLLSKALATGDSTSAQTIGLVTADIPHNSNGDVTIRGQLKNLDTSAFSVGAQLYLSGTTAGAFTATKTLAPTHLVYVGIVVRSNATEGAIEVAVQNGYELEELHDVSIGTLANNDLLAYESSTSLWKNKTYSALGLLTSATAAATYYLQTNPAGYITSSALSGYATESWVTSQGYLTSSALTGYATESWVTAGFYPLTGNPSSFLVAADIAGLAPLASPALTGNVTITTNSASPALFVTQTGTGNILTLHDQASDTTFVAIDQNGKVNTIASTTTNAGFNVPHGTAPTSPVNGDIWTTTAGLFYRINSSTKTTATLQDSQTFTGLNINLGTNTGTGTIGLATGATLSGSTKTVNIGTAGVAGSTTNINIGSTTGTSTTTLQGITNGVTQTAGDSSLKLATTAFVTTADNLKANLASPTFTGVPAAPTATAGTNTTQIATTAFVQQEVPAASTTAAGKVELATTDEALRPSSSTLGMTPDTTREMLMYPGYIQMFGAGNYATSGAGATNFVNGSSRWTAQRSPNASVAGYAMYIFDYSFTGIGMAAMTRGVSSIGRKWNNKIWASGRTVLGQWAETTSGLNGDANCTARVMVGGRSSAGTGGMQAADPGIGWRVAGGGSVALVMTVSNGSSVTETTSSFTPTLGQVFDWKMYSDGTGNVTLWVNDSQVATSTGGPSTSTTENFNFYCQVCEQTASATAPFAMGNFGTKVFWSPA